MNLHPDGDIQAFEWPAADILWVDLKSPEATPGAPPEERPYKMEPPVSLCDYNFIKTIYSQVEAFGGEAVDHPLAVAPPPDCLAPAEITHDRKCSSFRLEQHAQEEKVYFDENEWAHEGITAFDHLEDYPELATEVQYGDYHITVVSKARHDAEENVTKIERSLEIEGAESGTAGFYDPFGATLAEFERASKGRPKDLADMLWQFAASRKEIGQSEQVHEVKSYSRFAFPMHADADFVVYKVKHPVTFYSDGAPIFCVHVGSFSPVPVSGTAADCVRK